MSGPGAGLRIELGPSRISYRLGTAERPLQRFLTRHLRPGYTFYDVGANVGFFTLVGAAAVGRNGRVVAFEPLPANAALLRSNVALNHLAQVEVVQAAVADAAGEATLDPGASDQSARLDSAGTVPVAVVTLDDAVGTRRFPPPNLIKLDVEGAEHDALRGAADVLERFHPVVVCEVHAVAPSLDDHPVALLLRALGYELSWLEPDAATNPTFWAPHLVALPAAGPGAGRDV